MFIRNTRENITMSMAIFMYYVLSHVYLCIVGNHFDLSIAGELDANRPVPFRLTPSIQHFLSPVGVAGPLHMNMVAIARCLVQVHHSLPSIIQAILRDHFIAWQKVSVGIGCVMQRMIYCRLLWM